MNLSIVLEQKGAVLELTLNRPAASNAFDIGMAEALRAELEAIAAGQYPGARVLLLKAAGKYFCAGGDISFMTQAVAQTPAECEAGFARLIDAVHGVIEQLVALPLPVVAAVQGGAAGFGLSLMAACDMVVASRSGVFSTAYMGLGVTPDGGTTWLLPRLLGLRQARRLILLAERFSGEEALKLGLVERLVAAETVVSEAEALAEHLAQGPTAAQGRLKALLAASYQRPLAEQLAAEKASFLASCTSADFREGVSAFGERRPALFQGG